MLNQELEEANSVLKIKRTEVQRIEEEVALLMQVLQRCAWCSKAACIAPVLYHRYVVKMVILKNQPIAEGNYYIFTTW